MLATSLTPAPSSSPNVFRRNSNDSPQRQVHLHLAARRLHAYAALPGDWRGNDVWVEHSLHPVRKQMPRFLFENLIEQLTTQYGAVCSKPTRKARTK